MSNTPNSISTDAIQERIIKELDSNGDMPEDEYRRLVLISLSDLLRIIQPLPAKVKLLEETNIVLWIKRNKKFFCTVIIPATILIFMFLDEISAWVISHTTILQALKP